MNEHIHVLYMFLICSIDSFTWCTTYLYLSWPLHVPYFRYNKIFVMEIFDIRKGQPLARIIYKHPKIYVKENNSYEYWSSNTCPGITPIQWGYLFLITQFLVQARGRGVIRPYYGNCIVVSRPTSVSKAMRASGKEAMPHPQTTPIYYKFSTSCFCLFTFSCTLS